jgi:DNA primase
MNAKIYLDMMGYKNCVAIFWTSLSATQKAMLLDENINPNQKLILMVDDDEPWKKAKTKLANQLIYKSYLKLVKYNDGKTDPTELSKDELDEMIVWKIDKTV